VEPASVMEFGFYGLFAYQAATASDIEIRRV